jgi:hypothetical protein
LQKNFRCGRRFGCLVIQRKLRHGAHPVLQWCAANAVVTRDPAGGRKFDKAKSTGRIDALVALAVALSLALLRATNPINSSSDWWCWATPRDARSALRKDGRLQHRRASTVHNVLCGRPLGIKVLSGLSDGTVAGISLLSVQMLMW